MYKFPLFPSCCTRSKVIERVALMGLLFIAHVCEATAETLNLAINEQTMADALKQLSHSYQVSFAVKSEDIKALEAPSLSGQYQLEDALTELFRDTRLNFTRLGKGFVIEQKREPVEQVSLEISEEEVIVYGFQQSLKHSRDLKIESIDILDTVVSADFAQYPDLNLAESLQRLPGVTVVREAGEGRIVSLRGIAPDFTLVTLNGMPVLANNDSPMDSRGQKQRDRSFDFNIFSTDLFNQASAIKSYSAGQSAGGIAGTIALKTARPFDHAGFKSALSFQIGNNEYVDTFANRSSALFSYSGKNWGGLFSYSYSHRDVEEHGANTFRWRKIAIDDADLSSLDEDIQTGLRKGDFLIPRGNRYSVWTKEQDRLGLGAVFEYNSEAHKITLDTLYAELTDDRKEYHLYPRGSQSTPVISGETKIRDVEINNNDELVFARYENAQMATESRKQDVVTDFRQVVFNGKHQITHHMRLDWLLGSEFSKFHLPVSNKVYMQGVSDLDIDYRQDRFFADINYYNSELLDANNWRMSEIDQEYYRADTQFDTFKLTASFELFDGLTLNFGSELVKFSNKALLLFNEDIFKDEWEAYEEIGVGLNNQIPSHLSFGFFEHPNENWLALNTNEILTHYGIDTSLLNNSIESISSRLEGDLSENTKSVFLESNYKIQNLSIKGGVRYLKNTTDISYGDIEKRQSEWNTLLPTLNISSELNQNWFLKLGLSKNVTKPTLSDLFSAPEFSLESQTVYDGNIDLLPYSSKNIDLSIESVWSDSDLFSISIFYKKIDDYIVSQSVDVPFEDTDVFAYWDEPPFTENEIITLVRKQNTEDAVLLGVEAHLQHQFHYLPLPLSNFGVDIQVAWIDGQVGYYDENTGNKLFTKPMPFLSRKSGAFTLFHQSSKLSTRITATYRDKYLYLVNSNVLSDEDETGFHSTLYFDGQISYELTKQWQFKIEAFNLSNQREEQYSDSSNRPYNTTSSGRSIYFGISFNY